MSASKESFALITSHDCISIMWYYLPQFPLKKTVNLKASLRNTSPNWVINGPLGTHNRTLLTGKQSLSPTRLFPKLN